MARKKEDVNKIQFGSDEHITAIQSAYGIRKEVARKVVTEFEEGTKNWDVGYYDKCKRMISLIDNPQPKPVSPRKGWKRDRSY